MKHGKRGELRWMRWLGLGLAALLSGTAAAQPPSRPVPALGPASQPLPGTPVAQESTLAPRPEQVLAEAMKPERPLGPTPAENVRLLMDNTRLGQFLDQHGTRLYGWADMGYTYSSSGSGQEAIAPRPNRLGNEFVFNQLGVVLERPLKPGDWSWGFKSLYIAGADAALLQPKGGIDDPPGNPRFSHDFIELNVSAHLPVLTEGGVDVTAGRIRPLLSYHTALAPINPLYSGDYQFFYAVTGPWTGALTTWHVNPQLDVLHAFTLGASTFFTKRSPNSICYLGQVNYYLQEEKKTRLSAGILTGPNAILAAPGLAGDFVTVMELRVQQHWNRYLTQVLQGNVGWDRNVPSLGTGAWYGFLTVLIFHASETLDTIFRAEWFNDANGTRTGVNTHYEELTLGLDYHPARWISFRSEVRGDFSNNARAFENGSESAQLTATFEVLFKY